MNLQEFAALKKADKVRLLTAAGTSNGEVSDVSDSGVHIVWGARGPNERPFFYSVQSTAWFSWVKVQDDEAAKVATGTGDGSS